MSLDTGDTPSICTDGFETTINLSPVNCEDQTLSLHSELKMALPMPNQDEHLPDQIETVVHQAGLEAQRQLFQALLEKADQQLVLQRRQGKGGARHPAPVEHGPSPSRRSLARFTFGGRESATITMTRWRFPRQPPGTRPTNSTSPGTSATRSVIGSAIESAGKTPTTSASRQGTNLLGRSTIINMVHQGKRLTVATQEPDHAGPGRGGIEAQLALLGPAVADPDAMTVFVELSDLPFATSRRKPGPSGSRPRPSG